MTDKAAFYFVEGEEEVISKPAQKVGLWKAQRGRLVLTNRRLVFTHHRERTIRAEYPLSDIIRVSRAAGVTMFRVIWVVIGPPVATLSLWPSVFLYLFLLLCSIVVLIVLLRSAIRVTLKGGYSQRFIVSRRGDWISLINDYKDKALSSSAGLKQ